MTAISGVMIGGAGAGGTVSRPLRVPSDGGHALTVIAQAHPLWASLRPLECALENAVDGECVAYAVAVQGPLFTRLMTLVTFRFQRGRARRAIVRGGGRVVAAYGVDPSLEQPACVYELDTPAAAYADRCVRPRGRALGLRRLATQWFGCDPALGAVLVVGRK